MKTSGQRVQIGREQLYELVWSEAMVGLAKRVAITDVARPDATTYWGP